MMKRILKIFIIVSCLCLSLAGCGKKADISTTEQSNSAQTEGVSDTASSLEVAHPEVEDFYEAVNYALLNEKEIPNDSNNWSYFYDLDNQAFETLDVVLKETVARRSEHIQGSTEQKISDLYLTAINMEERDTVGLGALNVYLEKINGAGNVQEYADALMSIGRELSMNSSLSFFLGIDSKDSTKYAVYLTAPHLGPGKETLEDAAQADLMQEYESYIAALLTAAGRTPEAAKTSAAQIHAFQKDVASAALSLNDAGNPSFTYHVYTQQELAELFPMLDMERTLSAGGHENTERFIVEQPEAQKKLNRYFTEENLPLLKDYSTFCLLNNLANYLPSDIRNAKLNYDKAQRGNRDIKTDERLAGELVQYLLPFEFGRLYVETCFSEEDKTAVRLMVDEIIAEYGSMIDGLDWMSETTKESAGKKLTTLDIKIGYPDVWPDYTKNAEILPIEEGGSLIYNTLEIVRASSAHDWELAKGPVDRSIWGMTPQTVNAYYNPSNNEIVFPAAILQPPFYSASASKAENLGGIGTVIAHEITHAFDNSGSQYDENGNFNMWWTKEDNQKFKELTDQVVTYYDGFEGFEGRYVNGAQTLGENIADLGAISCVTDIIGDDTEQLKALFRRYAEIWAGKYTDESMIQQLNTDVHSPGRVRINAVLSSTDAFYKAYPELKEGDGMYIAPEKRVKVW